MAKLRHIAISVPDPEKSAQFYEAAFGLTRVGTGNSPLATSVYLSDGVINVTLLKYKSDEAAGERGRGYVGPHHVGFLVDDVDEARSRVEQHGATFFMGAPGAAPGVKGTTHFEEKSAIPTESSSTSRVTAGPARPSGASRSSRSMLARAPWRRCP